MDRLWVVKIDFEPFGRPRFAPLTGVGYLVSISRCSVYKCPYCRWIFKITWGPSNSLLGAGERACWHCKQVFWDDSNEWPEMSNEDRRLFLVPITIAGFIGAFALVPALMVWMAFFLKRPIDFQYGLFFTILGLPLGLWFGFRALQVFRSVQRYNQRGSRSAT
jgi:hypothetical protein